MVVKLKKSNISGKGIFAISKINKDSLIISIFKKKDKFYQTLFGSYTNHSSSPNTYMKLEDNQINLYSLKEIEKDAEIVSNYRDLKQLDIDLTHINIDYDLE